MDLTMFQDLIIAIFNMQNMSKEKEILDQYEEASLILHEMLLKKLGKDMDYYWVLETKEKNETNNN